MKVLYAAVKSGSVVYYADRPARHHNILHAVYDSGIQPLRRAKQGFVLSNGEWCSREVGLVIARSSGQILEHRHDHPSQLFSESIFEGSIDTASVELKQFDDVG